jgi:sulfofructose kinase
MADTMPLVFAGVAVTDTIAVVARMPGPDERVAAEEMTHGGGGPAATAAVAASRLGIPAAFVGAVGDDEDGDRILAGLSAEGVDVSGVIRVPGARSAASIGLVDRERRSRALVSRPAPVLRIDPSGPAARLLEAADWVHVDQAGWDAVARWRPGARFRLSVDAGNPIPGFSPRDIDLYAPTLEALRARYGDRPAVPLLEAALAEGAKCVAATCGGQGSIAAAPAGPHLAVPALPVEAVSTLGAGDVFHGALLAATVRGLPLRDRLAYANAAAGLSCRALDGRSAIPSHPETVVAAATLAAAASVVQPA